MQGKRVHCGSAVVGHVGVDRAGRVDDERAQHSVVLLLPPAATGVVHTALPPLLRPVAAAALLARDLSPASRSTRPVSVQQPVRGGGGGGGRGVAAAHLHGGRPEVLLRGLGLRRGVRQHDCGGGGGGGEEASNV